MEQTWYVAMIWMGLALIAGIISIRTAVSVALVEIFVGVIGGNYLGLDPNTEWIAFLLPLWQLFMLLWSKPV
ncbi:MAG: hypothetical protein AB7V04_11900 [Desulfomonilaceae bacterium]